MPDVTITAADVQSWIGRPVLNAQDTANLSLAVGAVVAYVNEVSDDTMAPDSSRKLGAIMLAAKVYDRRNTTSGIAEFQGLGVQYVAQYDPDIKRHLGLGVPRLG